MSRIFNRRVKSFLLLLSVVFSFSLCQCASSTKGAKGKAHPAPTGPVSLTSMTKNIDTDWDMIAQTAILNAGGHTVRLRVDSDVVLFDERLIKLSAPVKMLNSEVIVPADFYELVVRPMTAPEKRVNVPRALKQRYKIREIVLDAGHGGKDPGAISASRLQEKDVVLDITKRAAEQLRKEGLKVRLTRDRDEFISLEKRTEIASAPQVDMFLSIHANANTNRSINGVEVYVLRPQAKNDKEEQTQKNYHHLFSGLQVEARSDVSRIIGDMLDEKKSSSSEILAGMVGKQIVRATKVQNRGVKEAGFFVLRNTLVPAVLIEVGYLSNPREAVLLGDGKYRDKVARGIAKGIMAYINEKDQ